jgi:sugar phosphate isomerase/epimerase
MRPDQIALQLYTLRAHCRTAAEFAATVRRVRAIGYPAVQLSGLGPIPEDEIVRILAGEGLAACATHEPGEQILREPQRVVERLQKLGVRDTAYPWPGSLDLSRVEVVDELAAGLDAAGAVLRAAGCRLSYHNHAHELRRLGEGTVLDRLLARTRPENLAAELDTYWVQYGGGDPVAWCERLAGRLPLLHLKDYGLDEKNTPTYASVGDGGLDFRRIIAAADRAGCEWFIVEQDTTPGDPFDAVRRSYEFLRHQIARPTTP